MEKVFNGRRDAGIVGGQLPEGIAPR